MGKALKLKVLLWSYLVASGWKKIAFEDSWLIEYASEDNKQTVVSLKFGRRGQDLVELAGFWPRSYVLKCRTFQSFLVSLRQIRRLRLNVNTV